jgi:hypothetical protein
VFALTALVFGNLPFCLREIANEALVIFMVPHHCSHGEVVTPCGHENYKKGGASGSPSP